MALPSWALQLIVKLAIPFVVRQIAKWRDAVDFEKVKADFAERVRALIPGEWLDDEAVKLVNALVDKVAAALGATADLEAILKLVAAGDLAGALEKLKDLVLAQLQPSVDLSALTADEKDAKLCEALCA